MELAVMLDFRLLSIEVRFFHHTQLKIGPEIRFVFSVFRPSNIDSISELPEFPKISAPRRRSFAMDS
jgi:hypothetical protein